MEQKKRIIKTGRLNGGWWYIQEIIKRKPHLLYAYVKKEEIETILRGAFTTVKKINSLRYEVT